MPANNILYKLNNNFTSLLDLIYPIGSLYISSINSSPSSLFGGTWAAITNGAALRAADNYELVGSDTCTLTNQEMPTHSHNILPNGDTTYFYCMYGSQQNIDTYLGKEDPNGVFKRVVFSDLSKRFSGGNSTYRIITNKMGGGSHTQLFNALSIVLFGDVPRSKFGGDA